MGPNKNPTMTFVQVIRVLIKTCSSYQVTGSPRMTERGVNVSMNSTSTDVLPVSVQWFTHLPNK